MSERTEKKSTHTHTHTKKTLFRSIPVEEHVERIKVEQDDHRKDQSVDLPCSATTGLRRLKNSTGNGRENF